MERQLIRLECLKLADRPNRGNAEVLALAKDYENYVTQPVTEIGDSPSRNGKPNKKDDNAKPLK